jgi:hypothetical protein
MKNVTQFIIKQLLLVLPKQFNAGVALDVADKIQNINPSNTVNVETAKQNRLSVSNYWTRIFGVPLNSKRGFETLNRLSV